jgi:hypothetical protein
MKLFFAPFKCAIFMLASLGMLSACSDDSGGGGGTSSVTITEGSAASVLNAAGGSLDSADLIDVNTALSSRNQSTNDPLCSEFGEPWDTDTDAVMLDSNEAYAGRLFYCLVSSTAVESVDTIPGQLAQLESILCTMENGVGLTADSYTEAGAELVDSAPQSVSLPASCWPQGTPDGLTEVPLDSVVATLLDPQTDGFQYQIRLQASALAIDVTVKFFNSNGVFGFQKTEPGATGFAGSDFRITVDSNNGVLLANLIEDRGGAGGADSVYRTLMRLRVAGTMSAANFRFTQVNAGRGYVFISGPALDDGLPGGNDTTFAYNAYTVDGTSDNGFEFTRWMTMNSDTTDPSSVSTTCDGSGDCSGALSFDETAMNAFMAKDAAGKSGWDTFIASGLPMCDAASGADAITFSDVPSSTGALGVCN